MAYVAPTVSDLTTRHPEFSVVASARMQLFLDEAIAEVDATWLDLDRARAQIELACHNMSLFGEPAASGGASTASGPIESASVGDVSVTYGKWSLSNGIAYSSKYDATPYGSEFHMLLNRNHGGPRAI